MWASDADLDSGVDPEGGPAPAGVLSGVCSQLRPLLHTPDPTLTPVLLLRGAEQGEGGAWVSARPELGGSVPGGSGVRWLCQLLSRLHPSVMGKRTVTLVHVFLSGRRVVLFWVNLISFQRER